MKKTTLPSPKHALLIRKALSEGSIYGLCRTSLLETCVGEQWLVLREGGCFYPTIIGKAALEAYDAPESSDALEALQKLLADNPVARRPTICFQMFGEYEDE